MILKKVEGRRNPRAWHGSQLTVSGLHGHPSTPNPRPKRRVETPGDPWGVPQPPGPSSPAYGTPPTANRWFLPLSSSQWGQTLPTTSVMFPVRIEPRGHAQGGKKIPGEQRMTPLEELRELCNDILTLRSNILVVFSRFSTCCLMSTSNSRSPDFSFLIVFG